MPNYKYKPYRILKIMISVGGNPAKTDGTLIRAKRVWEILREKHQVELMGYRGFATDMPALKLVILLPFWLLEYLIKITMHRYDYVYCCNNRYGFLLFWAFRPLFRYRIIYEAHSIISEEFKNMKKQAVTVQLNKCLEKLAGSHSNMVIALSETTFNFFKRYNRNTRLIPVFLDTDLFRMDQVKRAAIREGLGISDKFVAGIVGPFNIVFNRHYLSFLQENSRKFDEKVRLMVIGECQKRSAGERIIYTGFVEDYIGYLSAVDCVVVPADIPTGGPKNKILESMSMGLPVITTPAGSANLDYASNGQDILIYEEADMVREINRMAGDAELVRIGSRARLTVEKFYSLKTNSSKLMQIFENTSKE